jgi:hypothetical protein
MGVQTGTDLLGAHGWRKRLAQARLGLVIASSVRLAGRSRVVVKELVLPGGDICNPSIARHRGELLAAVRRPSYRLIGGRLRLAPGRTLDSETFVLTLDRHLDIVDTVTVDTGPTTRRFPGARDGLEDPRLFTVAGRLFCLWSGLSLGSRGPSRDHDGIDWDADWSETTNTMVVGELRGEEVVAARSIPSPTSRPREKNWMPLDGAEDVEFAYYVADGEYLEGAVSDGAARVRRVPVPESARRLLAGWSGSSQAIEWGDGRLCVVHLALRGIPLLSRVKSAVYLHRFVVLDADGRVSAISRPFRFLGVGIEFCAGAALDADQLLLSFGVDDHRAFVCRVPVTLVRSLLRSVP